MDIDIDWTWARQESEMLQVLSEAWSEGPIYIHLYIYILSVWIRPETSGTPLGSPAEGAALKQRVKLILRPIKARDFCPVVALFLPDCGEVRLPFPSSPPKDAEFVGPYFGDGATMDSDLQARK